VIRPADPLPIWIDDRLVSTVDAVVSAYDTALRSGLGVFETLRAHGTRTLAWDRHIDRLGRGAARLSIPFDGAHVGHALRAILEAPRRIEQVVVRITLTAGPLDPVADWPPVPMGRPTLIITLHPAPRLPLPPATAVTSEARRWPADVKSTSYLASLLAAGEARAAGAGIAVLADGDELLETAEGNLFAVTGGMLVTPPDDGRLLPGVTRQLLLEAAPELGIPVRIAPLRRADLPRLETLAASSSVAGLRTILSIDGVTPDGRGHADDHGEHPVVVALRDRLATARG
jgi:branched-chain amino acid aminotransferase